MGSSTDIIMQPSAPRVTITSLHPLSNSMRPTFSASSRLPTGTPVKISAWKITHANENHNLIAFNVGQQLLLKTVLNIILEMCLMRWSWNHFLRWYSAMSCSLFEISMYFRHRRLVESSLGRDTGSMGSVPASTICLPCNLYQNHISPACPGFFILKRTQWHSLGKSILLSNVKMLHGSSVTTLGGYLSLYKKPFTVLRVQLVRNFFKEKINKNTKVLNWETWPLRLL